jgi:hypothetical protein
MIFFSFFSFRLTCALGSFFFRKRHRQPQITLSLGCEQRELRLPLTVPVPPGSRSSSVTCDEMFTGQSVRQLKKNTNNSLTTENKSQIHINF